VPSSFRSLRSTLVHMWDADSVWWHRLKMQEGIVAPGNRFTGTTDELAGALLQQGKQWEAWIAQASEAAIGHVFHYQNSRRELFKQPVYQMLLHVFNHATYHRGQLVNILRQLNIDTIPQTDFIAWSRMKK
jgi:uncharacterized damage-inducible protein DinB